MRMILAAAVLWPGLAMAESWEVLDGRDIALALKERVLIFDAYTQQRFGAGGDTRYMTERVADGRWEVRGDQYCSSWPPSDIWTCYDVERNTDRIRFIGPDGSVSEGTYAR